MLSQPFLLLHDDQVFTADCQYSGSEDEGYKVETSLPPNGAIPLAIHCLGSEETKGGAEYNNRMWRLHAKIENTECSLPIVVWHRILS